MMQRFQRAINRKITRKNYTKLESVKCTANILWNTVMIPQIAILIDSRDVSHVTRNIGQCKFQTSIVDDKQGISIRGSLYQLDVKSFIYLASAVQNEIACANGSRK